MIEIQNFPIRNKFTEITVGEFDIIMKLLTDEKKSVLEQYIKIFKLMGGTDDLVEKLSMDELLVFVKSLGADDYERKEIPKKVEIEGVTYKIYEDKIKIFAKDLVAIENHIKKDKVFSAAYAIAILMKKEGEEKFDHYNKKHIEEKKEKIKNLPVLNFLPLIIYLTESLGQKLSFLNATTPTKA